MGHHSNEDGLESEFNLDQNNRLGYGRSLIKNNSATVWRLRDVWVLVAIWDERCDCLKTGLEWRCALVQYDQI